MAYTSHVICLVILCVSIGSAINRTSTHLYKHGKHSTARPTRSSYYHSNFSVSRHNPTTARNLYPTSSGLSGSGKRNTSHSDSGKNPTYPVSGGLSGNKGLYPNSHGLSGNTGPRNSVNSSVNSQSSSLRPGHQYPNSSGLSGIHKVNTSPVKSGHIYPNSSGLSGKSEIHKVNASVNTQSSPIRSGHIYPNSSGLSGNNTYKPTTGVRYPDSTGLSGGGFKYTTQKPYRHTEKTYYTGSSRSYKPPQRIYYKGYKNQTSSFSTYKGELPSYINTYRKSNSKFGHILTGLGLYNLGQMSVSKDTLNHHNSYQRSASETCKFGILFNKQRYEETIIDCRLMTSVILVDKDAAENSKTVANSRTVTVNRNAILNPDGLLKDREILDSMNVIKQNDGKSLDVKNNGAAIKGQHGMLCYMIWNKNSEEKVKQIDCGLLQAYYDMSFNSATKITSGLIMIVAFVIIGIA